MSEQRSAHDDQTTEDSTDAGNLHVTDDPPKDRRYERISRTPEDGITVDGGRG